jgi:hypothetical protein
MCSQQISSSLVRLRCHTHGGMKNISSENNREIGYDSRDFHPDISSSNPPQHGCRSQKLILRHEDPNEYEALHASWWDEYQPSDFIEETLVQLLIDNHCFLKRARLRLEQVEWEMPLNGKHWMEGNQKQVEIFTRFKTTAERAFQRAFREVELHYNQCVRSENAAYKAELMRLKIEAQIAPKPEEVKQIALKMATPLYRDRRHRATARKAAHNRRLPVSPSTASPPDPASPVWTPPEP